MKEINVDSHNVPATARSKNYQTALATTAASGGGATTPSVVTPTGGAADTAKVAQNLAEDSTDWAKILRKDIDERTENALSIGKNLTVDGQAILNDVVANTGTFGGLLKAAAATITGALLASTVSATTVNATTFIGELQGNAATATKLKTARTIWGQGFDGSGNVDGRFVLGGTNCFTIEDMSSYRKIQTGGNVPLSINPSGNNVGIGTTTPAYALDVYGDIHSNHSIIADTTFNLTNGLLIDQGASYARLQSTGKFLILNANGNKVGIGTVSPAFNLDVSGTTRFRSYTYVGSDIGTLNFASHTTGWNVNPQGAADFRNIYADELRVQAFTADISQALAGSDYLTKSVSKLSANFVVPSVNSTVRIIVDDIEGMPATQCFTNGDYIRFRAFNRTSGLTIANVWGTVTLDTSYGSNGFSNGTQAYTFTCKATTGAGLTVFKGSEVLDYGTSGSGLIARTTLDAMGSPYEQIATWQTDPSISTNYTVHARLGNLNGIANCSGYGLYTDNGFFTGKIVIGDLTKTANFLSFDSVNGLQVKIGGTSVATTTDVSNSLTTANTNAQGYANTAQTNAITTASGDATTKANAAYSNAVTYTNTQITATNNSITAVVNGIQIADRNILQKSYLSLYRATYNSTTHTWSGVITTTGDSYWRWDLHSLMDEQYIGKITISFIASSTVAGQMSIMPSTYYGSHTTVNLTTTPTYYSHTFDIDFSAHGDWGGFSFAESLRGATVTIKEIMISKGSVALPYRPAIEDIESNINTAQSTAISTAATNAAALYVTQTAYSSQITILQNSINAKVSQTDFNALNTRVGTAESNITQNANAITTKVSQTTFDALGTRVSTAETAITQNTTDIGLKVSKDGVIGAINLTSEAATINASKINLVGAVTISSISSDALNTIQGYSTTAVSNLSNAHGNFTYIDGNSVYTGTLTANQVNAVGISASSITTGTLSANRIGANTITFDKLVGTDITALGNVTAGSFNIGSGKFVVDSDGNLTSANANITGKITATEGSVGPFTISQLDGLTATSGDQSLLLKARLIRFTGGTTSAVYIGTDVVPGSWGGSFTCPVRVEESRPTTTSGNIGIYLSVTGASVSDSTDYISNSALFLDRGVITGFRTRQRRLNYSQTLSLLDTTIIDTSTSSDSTYTLPTPNEDGQRYEFITTDRYIKIKPSAGQTLQYGIDPHIYTSSEYITVVNGNYAICIYNAVSSRWMVRDSRGS